MAVDDAKKREAASIAGMATRSRQPRFSATPRSGPERRLRELSDSCLKFVIVDYDASRAACKVIGKTDLTKPSPLSGLMDCRDPRRPAAGRRAARRGARARARLQFATNARHGDSGFSLHCLHATCMPAVADRSA
ncbi:hypothetical protein [Burkholderia ubonensis]|uniref:hypothetical protein n=1 Tax=Burkholderia ubonensis TaxID=101571 RepID=UPI0012FC5AC8|nr:hypothetical protein [Burkholderia ubonensis]